MSRHRLTSLRRHSLSGGNKGSVWDLYATNGFLRPVTNTNSSVKWVEDLDGTLVQSPANKPAMPGMRLTDGVWYPTASDGSLISPISRMIRTAQGSVAEYDETYPGVLVEPAATNYLLNTATPATQTTGSLAAGTYTLWIEGAGSAAVTAGTATIADNGTASAGSPNTFTVSVAGTVTVTVTDPVTFFQLEGGAFPTSKIPTTTAAVTRAADNVSFPTPSWLLAHPNDFAVIGTFKPGAVQPTGGAYLFVCGTNAINMFSIGITSLGTLLFAAKYNSAVTTQSAKIDIIQNVAQVYEYVAYSSVVYGIGLALRYYDGTTWSSWSSWEVNTTADAKLNAVLGTSCYIGSRLNALHYCATYPMTRLLRIPTNLSAAALQAWLIAKAGA